MTYHESDPNWRADLEDGQLGNEIGAKDELANAYEDQQKAPAANRNRSVFPPGLHLIAHRLLAPVYKTKLV